jgi:hypothetical protein
LFFNSHALAFPAASRHGYFARQNNPLAAVWEGLVFNRRHVLLAGLGLVAGVPRAFAAQRPSATDVLQRWYDLTLELVRHTATYSPPVASRAFAYLGITAFECVATLGGGLQTLSGQLPALQQPSLRTIDKNTDLANALHGALQLAISELFSNTGPTGQRAIRAVGAKLDKALTPGLKAQRVKQSRGIGVAIARHLLEWSKSDGGAEIANLGFPESYAPGKKPGSWVPTSAIRIQQAPLLPDWGKNRTFAIADGAACLLPPPPAYSEDKASEFYKQALEVHDTVKAITPEQRLIARFWSDDPMLSPTPPGHWIFVALDLLNERKASIEDSVDLLARMGVAMSDAFVACWSSKYDHDLLRPVTYIKKVIDKTWEPILITPPFPEYPSGHSTQSGAVAEVLTAFFGENFAFEDRTHVREKLPVRRFASFRAAAEEAAISRLYGGIHFRAACERGLEQGRCVGLAVNAIKTRKTV